MARGRIEKGDRTREEVNGPSSLAAAQPAKHTSYQGFTNFLPRR